MKNIFAILFVFLFVVSCGGGGTTSQQDEQTPSVSGDAIIITSITGDGSSSDRFVNEMYVAGQNFTDDMAIDLVSDAASFSMDYSLGSSTRITAQLPENLVEGIYELTIVNSVGTAQSTITILHGEDGVDGEDGQNGEDGANGISIASQYYCGMSGDIDNTADTRYGVKTDVTKFSDGSYSVTCLVSYLNSTYLYYETSSYTNWYAYNSNAVVNGELICVPFYVSAYYYPATNIVVYANQSDYSQYQAVSCSQTYP